VSSSANVDDSWAELTSPANLVGFSQDAGEGSGQLRTPLFAATRSGEFPPIWSPQNPLFWFVGLLILGTGAVYMATTVKVGPITGTLKT
jgi:hypothetical protein